MQPIPTLKYEEVVRAPYDRGAIVRDDFPGFREDYLAIHCLIREYRPRRIVEIGTSTGSGTNVLCRAMRIRRFWYNGGRRVLSIDVPPGTDSSIIYPGDEPEDGHPAEAGSECRFPYDQLFGDSGTFDFSPYYPIDAWFIDGKHSYDYVVRDSEQALRSRPHLVIWHDLQIDGVHRAIRDVMASRPEFDVYRIGDTRVGAAIRRP